MKLRHVAQFTYGLHCIQIKVVFNLKQDAVAKLWLLQQGEKGKTAIQVRNGS